MKLHKIAALAAALAALSTTLGTVLAWTADLPLSPAIISIAGGMYFAVLIATHQWRRPQSPPPEKT